MIKLENTEVLGWEHAIRGMRNPKNSWDRSDSSWIDFENWNCGHGVPDGMGNAFVIGENDHKLMMNLASGGPVHAKYRRMIVVYVDITAPLYWWSEFDTYKVGTVANSCSKMHKLLEKPFEMSDFSFDQLFGYKRVVRQFRPSVDEDREFWVKYDCDYEVSSQGRVRRGSRVLSGSIHNDGYIFVTIHGKQRPVHRLVAEVFLPNYENKPEVNHIDGNKMNCCVDNLEWATRSENQKHAVDNGLQPRKVSTYKGKFSSKEREKIKREWDSGKYSRREIAKKYGVSHTCINDIVNDKYKYIETVNLFEEAARPTVDALNELRDSYFACEIESVKKEIWYSILQLLPESYNQKRTVMLNYEVLAGIYPMRKDHKLDEWREFCKWIKSLPYSELITGYENKES